mgnify:FL=1
MKPRIKKSARFELLDFLKIDQEKLGTQKSRSSDDIYTALVLPETASGYPPGHALVSFLIDPATLLRQSYVLRKDGWRDNDAVYQRIMIKKKIKEMRKYLTKEGRVFVNNVVLTLPNDLRLHDKDGAVINGSLTGSAHKEPVKISIPRRAGNIGIIDGQHRVFAYHEGNDEHEKRIGTLREQQHLLATGIVYPKDATNEEKARFEAALFLEINDRQTRTQSALRQVIGTIVDPFSEISIAKMVVGKLAAVAPMKGCLQQHFFDQGKLKTTSIVSYGMKHVVKLSGKDSFYWVWTNPKKGTLSSGNNRALLDQYVDYCTSEITIYLAAFKKNIPSAMWTVDQHVSRVLTATTITGLLHCMRTLIEKNRRGDFAYYDKKFKKISAINFSPGKFVYKSSHWKSFGDRVYELCFK